MTPSLVEAPPPLHFFPARRNHGFDLVLQVCDGYGLRSNPQDVKPIDRPQGIWTLARKRRAAP